MLTGPGDSMLLPFGGFFGSQSESETAKYSWLKVSQREKKKKPPNMNGNVSMMVHG